MSNIINNGQLTPEQLAYLRQQKIMIGTPMYGGQCLGQYTGALCDLHRIAGQLGINVKLNVVINESLVQRGRNALAHQFMKSDYTHLIFVDADILFSPFWIFDLVLQQRDIIGGFYPKKCINWESVENALTKYNVDPSKLNHCGADIVPILKEGTKGTIQIFEPLEVTYLGTGFMCITRKAFETFQKAYPDRHYLNNHVAGHPMGVAEQVWAYFDCCINDRGVYLSEDYYFCEKLIEAGIPIWACPWMNCNHVGTYLFEGCLWCSRGAIIHDIKRKAPAESPLAKAARLASEKK